MIFITKEHDGKPLFRGFVNGINEHDTKNGGKITTYIIGTREKKRDENFEYSSWFAIMIGEARKKCSELSKDDMIDVYGFKQTNVSKKNDDGTFGRPFFNMSISDYEIHNGGGGNKQKNNSSGSEEYPDDENPF